MHKPTIALALLSLPTLAWLEPREAAAGPPVSLKEEALYIEYTATANEAVVVVDAESEDALDLVELRDPYGAPLLRLRSEGTRGLSLSGIVLETQEDTPEAILDTFAEGFYELRGRTIYGQPAAGGALLSHDLPTAPVVTHPAAGDVNVTSKNLTVNWVNDPEVSGYRVILEQNENDGLVVELPGDSNSFQVPKGYLLPDTETQLEVGARGPNGNITLVEVIFTTR